MGPWDAPPPGDEQDGVNRRVGRQRRHQLLLEGGRNLRRLHERLRLADDIDSTLTAAGDIVASSPCVFDSCVQCAFKRLKAPDHE